MRGRWLRLTLLALFPLAAGCNIIGAIAVMTAPRQMQDAEIKLTTRRLALFIEYARPSEENPVFTRAFRKRLIEILQEHDAIGQVIAEEKVFRLRQKNPDFGQWSLQRIGRELGADQILYVRIERLVLQSSPENPLITPQVTLRMKVIAPDELPTSARLWPGPREHNGREITRTRQTRAASDAVLLDAEAAKLGKDTAWLAAKPFYKHDLEKSDPWEP